MSDTLNGLGLERGTVRLVAADAAWPGAYRLEVDRLSACLEQAHLPALLFEHVGSTAIPGLVAKPIIDFMAGCDARVDPRIYFATFREVGYEHRGPQGVPVASYLFLGPRRSARTTSAWFEPTIRSGGITS